MPFSTSVYLTLISKIAVKALTSGRAAPHPLLQRAEALTRARFYFARRMHILLVFSFFLRG